VEDVRPDRGRTNFFARRDPRQLSRLPAAPEGFPSDAYLRNDPAHRNWTSPWFGVGRLALNFEGRVCTAARVGLGRGGADRALVEAAAKALIGSKLDDAGAECASQRLRAACRPIDDKRGTIVLSNPKLPACCSSARLRSPPSAQKRKLNFGELKTMAKLHVSTTINGEPAEFLCEPK